MRGAFGIIIYLIGIILPRLLKKAAQERVGQSRPLPAQWEEPPALTGDQWLLEGPSPEFVAESPAGEELAENSYEDIYEFEDWEDWEEGEGEKWERLTPNTGEESLERWEEDHELSPLARAVIMAEIIREPRARRPWPKR